MRFAKYFSHYLWGRPFLVRSDHSSLKWLKNFKQPEGMVARWIATLDTYDFQIEHRKGASHGNADGCPGSQEDVRVQSVLSEASEGSNTFASTWPRLS